MKITAFIACAVLLSAASAWAQDALPASLPVIAPPAVNMTKQPLVDLSTPEKTLRSILDALTRSDYKAVSECVSGGNYTADMKAFEADIHQGKLPQPATVHTILVSPRTQETGDTAVVTFRLRFEGAENSTPGAENVITLKHEETGWKIVAPTEQELQQSGIIGDNFILSIAILARYPQVSSAAFSAARASALANIAIQNMHQLSLACLMYLEDYDHVFRFTVANFRKTMQPYLQSDASFTSPLDPKGTLSYHFNPKLAENRLASVTDPSRTVMLYEGEWQKPLFRYRGKAIIGFVDGSIKPITPDQVKTLLWQLPAKAVPKSQKRGR